MLSIIVAPYTSPQVAAPPAPPPPKLNDLDREIVAALGERTGQPSDMWAMIRELAAATGAPDREALRLRRLDVLDRVMRLVRHKMLRRVRRGFLVLPTAGQTGVTGTGSTHFLRRGRRRRGWGQPVQLEGPADEVNGNRPTALTETVQGPGLATSRPAVAMPQFVPAPSQDRSARSRVADMADVAEAASLLGSRPRGVSRRWTGFIGTKRCWRDRLVWLANGQLVFVFGVFRQKVVYTLDRGQLLDGLDGEPMRWGVVRAQEVTIWIDPLAQVLGRQKRGVREKPSVLKAATARMNGARPCRPGRRRGRPRSSAVHAHSGV